MKFLSKNKFTITTLLVGTIFICEAVNAADGTINFAGNIIAEACAVDASSANQIVNLGNISTKEFTNKGDVASATQFSINLTSCPATLTKAQIKFDGATDANDPSVLALSSGQTATNVGVALYEADDLTQIPVASPSREIPCNGATPTAFHFIAKYKATAAAVGAGSANSVANFTISYN